MWRSFGNLSKRVVAWAHPVNGAHARVLAVVWVTLAGATGGSGCWNNGDDCDPGCDGNTVVSCGSASYGTYSTTQTCEGTCVVHPADYHPFCALDDKPDASCGGGSEPRCDGATLVECDRGYETKRTDCTGFDSEALGLQPTPDTLFTCVREPLGAKCLRVYNADPRCDEAADKSHFCDGDVIVFCRGRYPYWKQRCTSVEACAIGDPNSLDCRL